uniref:3-dehydroquinate dehydratase n=1 Tax=Caldisericum exile TaxID=693075 RepID=A0A7C4U080_9BACT
MKRILVINGPNLNMLGVREVDTYGKRDLNWVNQKMSELAATLGITLDFFQSNSEGEIITKIQEGMNYDGIIINPGGFSHTSVAILDAIRSIDKPVIEVHLTNIFAREDFRNTVITGRGAKGIITGLGYISYLSALYSFYLLFKEEEYA